MCVHPLHSCQQTVDVFVCPGSLWITAEVQCEDGDPRSVAGDLCVPVDHPVCVPQSTTPQ